MPWLVIVFVMLALIGSMMWMMPSPRERAQAILRQHAMRTGLQVQMSNLLFPRAIGEAAPEERHCTAYRLARFKQARVDHYAPWQVFRLSLLATQGLPEGWGWGRGEGVLNAAQCELVSSVIATLPRDAYALESTPVALSVYWHESGSQATVDELKAAMQQLVDAGI